MNEIIKKNGITFGVIMGVFSVLATTLIYVINLELFTSWWIGLLIIAISIILGIILLSKTRRENGGFTFKEAFTTYFLAAVIGSTISVLFNIVLFNLIDPSAKETLQEISIKYTVELMQKFGARAADINDTVKELKNTDNYAPGNQLFGLVVSFIFSAIFGLILALIFKNKSSQQL